MARVMPLLLTMKRWPVPDLDAVFSGTDYPIMEIPRDAAHMQRMYRAARPTPTLPPASSLQPPASSLRQAQPSPQALPEPQRQP